jgi:hypothetical protein
MKSKQQLRKYSQQDKILLEGGLIQVVPKKRLGTTLPSIKVAVLSQSFDTSGKMSTADIRTLISSNTGAVSQVDTTGLKLTEFKKFPELPIELRLKIWRYTFQKRDIDLGPPPPNLVIEKWRVPKTIPITFFVNQLSRGEALRFYTRVVSSDKEEYVMATNPKFDSCFISLHNMAVHDIFFSEYVDRLDRQLKVAGGSLKVIKKLEIRDMNWCWCFTSGMGALKQAILRFKDLDELTITFSAKKSHKNYEAVLERFIQECHTLWKKALADHALVFEDYKAPKIIVRS